MRAAGSWIGKDTDGDGKVVNAKERWGGYVGQKAGGKWQCVASASAPTT
jgi:hypothetical protein